MPSDRRRSCVVCGRHDSEVGPISWRGKCGECGPLVASLANDQIHYHVGPVFEKWRRRMAASVGAVLEEDTRKA